MELFGMLKFWRNRAPQVNEDSFDLEVTYPHCDFDKSVPKKINSSIVISSSVGITSLDNDINKQYVHENLSNLDGQVDANAFNAKVFLLSKLKTNFKSRSQVVVLKSSPKLRVSMLRFKKSSSFDQAELNCITSMATPKREQGSFKSKKEKPDDSSKNKYLKLIKQASKVRIFDQSVSANSRVDGEKQQGSRPTVFREVCKSLMKSKSSVRTVPVPVSRRDDSALQQQDGIQSAILHCKRSYSSSSSSSSFSTISQECAVFSRSASESSHQKAAINPQIIVSSVEAEMK